MKKLVSILVAGALVSMLGIAHAAPTKAVTVFTDPAGDADNGQGTGQSIPAGFDLLSGTVARDGANLVFTITEADMPPNGALPEGFRLMWHFGIGGKEYRFTAKSADIGKPDPLSGPNGTDRIGQVWLDGVFRLENWVEGATVAVLSTPTYNTLGYLDGAFDPAAKTITVKVPMKLIKAKPGQVVAGGTGAAASTSCQICWVPQYAERSLTPQTIIDYATMNTTYKIPK
ncbi:MAG TPA: hypothetical protein VFK89_01245 [Actinomycetota bacterium]|nr:hypothetical protein [Actinomycetota bacterium]